MHQMENVHLQKEQKMYQNQNRFLQTSIVSDADLQDSLDQQEIPIMIQTLQYRMQ